MAKKNKGDNGKPSALSEEYIIESSGDEDVLIEETQPSPEASPTPVRKEKSEKSKKRVSAVSPPKVVSPSSEPQEEEEEEEQAESEPDRDVTGGISMLNDSAVQVTASPESSRERPRKKQKPASTSGRSVPARRYKPPTGFKHRSITPSDSAAQSTQFLTHGLSGKQVWHITAAANVPIDSIKTFAIAAVMKGQPIQNSNGTNYTFTAGPSVNKCLLTASGSEDDYVPSEIPIHRTYHLREVINPPAETRDKGKNGSAQKQKTMHFEAQPSEAEGEIALGVPAAKPLRQQPKELRMRYKPFGTTKATPESLPAPDESEAEQSELDVPAQILIPPPEKHSKKQKKRQQTPGSRSSNEEADVMDVHTSTQTSTPKAASSQSGQIINGSPVKQGEAEEGPREKEKKKKSKKHKARAGSAN